MNPSIQYFKPAAPELFVGDCMPFSQGGTFFFYYLQDENHHQGLGGLGGHQWALATSADLRSWTHHPLALPITAEWEGSICTGSVLYHEGTYYAFYATRRRDYTQHLSLALSQDGIHYEKTQPNPLFSPPAGYSPYHFRDPFAFRDEAGLFHLLVTAFLEDQPVREWGGCLAHLVSTDLKTWEMRPPFFSAGTPDAPECPDYFFWKGWYYLLFSSEGVAHYRKSRTPFGPWERPRVDTFEGFAARVMKTAPWQGRRIGAAWIGERHGMCDAGEYLWGGQSVLRELVQDEDGSLGVRFVDELQLPAGASVQPRIQAVTPGVKLLPEGLHLPCSGGLEVVRLQDVPMDARIRLRLELGCGEGPFGLRLRGGEVFNSGYDLSLFPAEHSLRLAKEELRGVNFGAGPLELEIIQRGSILDVCLNRRYCLITRAIDRKGTTLWLHALDRELRISGLEVQALI
jgi:hypothetical protein